MSRGTERYASDPGLRRTVPSFTPVSQTGVSDVVRGKEFPHSLDPEETRVNSKFVFMVMDQAGWHIAGKLAVSRIMRADVPAALHPELNLAEHRWKAAMREDRLANHVFADLDRV